MQSRARLGRVRLERALAHALRNAHFEILRSDAFESEPCLERVDGPQKAAEVSASAPVRACEESIDARFQGRHRDAASGARAVGTRVEAVPAIVT